MLWYFPKISPNLLSASLAVFSFLRQLHYSGEDGPELRILYSALKPTQIQNNSCGWELSSMPADKVSVFVCLLYVPTTAFCVDRAVELLVIKFFFIIDCTRLQI